jgi:hypothetical protein
MPLFVQTGNVKPMYGREFPSARQHFELVRRIATFHCEQSPAADTQMSRPLHKTIDGTDGARDDDIETLIDSVVLGTFVDGDHVRNAKHQRDVLDEFELFRRRIKQRELPLRIRDGQRQTWEASAGPDVENALASEKWLYGQAVEQVLRDLLRSLANGGEIDSLIPVIELIEQAQHALRIAVAEIEAELLGGGLQHRWLFARSPGDRARASADLDDGSASHGGLQVGIERGRQLIERNGLRDDAIEVTRLEIACDALPDLEPHLARRDH